MAISIDSVYKEVLNIIKNEDVEKGYESSQRSFVRRPYLTPLEFNQFAQRVQLDMVENYVNDYREAMLKNNQETADYYRYKLSDLHAVATVGKTSGAVSPSGIVYLERIYDETNAIDFEKVDKEYFRKVKRYSSSKAFLTSTTPKNHIYYMKDRDTAVFYPTPTNTPSADVIKLPTDPKWDFTVANNEVLYNSSGSQDFELMKEDTGTLINKIVELAATFYREPGLADLSLRNEATNAEDKTK
jgi:hypothetical protein